MNAFVKILLTGAVALLCQSVCAADRSAVESPATKVLETGAKTKKLEGSTLKMVRPILKKTPISAILDNIDMMMICPLEKGTQELTAATENLLKSYTLVREINDELSHMYIYIDTPANDRFSELLLYTTAPDPVVMLFQGEFTVDGLIKVGELSQQDRKRRIRDKNR